MYYLRSKPAQEAVQVTVDPTLIMKEKVPPKEEPPLIDPPPEGWVCRKEEGCITCSS